MNTFDFDKAIAGEPIYCNGERIKLFYDPEYSGWKRENNYVYGWEKFGRAIASGGEVYPISTTNPGNKVKKTIIVTIIKYGDGQIGATTLPKEQFQKVIGTYPIEIEVEE